MNKITNNQKEKINFVFEEALNDLKLSEKNAEKIIKLAIQSKEKIKYSLKQIIWLDEIISPFPDVEFEIIIPENYQQLIDNLFSVENKNQKILKIDLEMKHYFLKKKNVFIPGEHYVVKLFPIIDRSKFTLKKSIIFLKENDVLNEKNKQILFLIQIIKPEYVPKDCYIFGIDDKPYKTKNGYEIPSLLNRLEIDDAERNRCLKGGWFFRTRCFKDLNSIPCDGFNSFRDYSLLGIHKKE